MAIKIKPIPCGFPVLFGRTGWNRWSWGVTKSLDDNNLSMTLARSTLIFRVPFYKMEK